MGNINTFVTKQNYVLKTTLSTVNSVIPWWN